MNDTRTNVYCHVCAGMHAAEVLTRDEHGWADEIRLVGPHVDTGRTRADVLEDMGRAGARAMAIALDAGRWWEVERIAGRVLEVNDPREGA